MGKGPEGCVSCMMFYYQTDLDFCNVYIATNKHRVCVLYMYMAKICMFIMTTTPLPSVVN